VLCASEPSARLRSGDGAHASIRGRSSSSRSQRRNQVSWAAADSSRRSCWPDHRSRPPPIAVARPNGPPRRAWPLPPMPFQFVGQFVVEARAGGHPVFQGGEPITRIATAACSSGAAGVPASVDGRGAAGCRWRPACRSLPATQHETAAQQRRQVHGRVRHAGYFGTVDSGWQPSSTAMAASSRLLGRIAQPPTCGPG